MTDAEHQVDFGRPRTDTLDPRETRRRVPRVQRLERRQVELLVDDGLGHGAHGAVLAGRKAHRPHLCFRQPEIATRLQRAVEGREACPDRAGARHRQLLTADHLGEAGKARLALAHLEGAGRLRHRHEPAIAPQQGTQVLVERLGGIEFCGSHARTR